MKKIAAFVLGVYEFRRTLTKYYSNYSLRLAYDAGRDFAHWATFRKFE